MPVPRVGGGTPLGGTRQRPPPRGDPPPGPLMSVAPASPPVAGAVAAVAAVLRLLWDGLCAAAAVACGWLPRGDAEDLQRVLREGGDGLREVGRRAVAGVGAAREAVRAVDVRSHLAPGVVAMGGAGLALGLAAGHVAWRWLPRLAGTVEALDRRRAGLAESSGGWLARRRAGAWLRRQRRLLPLFLREPDAERASWLNNAIAIFWPHLNAGVDEIVRDQVEPAIVSRPPAPPPLRAPSAPRP